MKSIVFTILIVLLAGAAFGYDDQECYMSCGDEHRGKSASGPCKAEAIKEFFKHCDGENNKAFIIPEKSKTNCPVEDLYLNESGAWECSPVWSNCEALENRRTVIDDAETELWIHFYGHGHGFKRSKPDVGADPLRKPTLKDPRSDRFRVREYIKACERTEGGIAPEDEFGYAVLCIEDDNIPVWNGEKWECRDAAPCEHWIKFRQEIEK